MINIHYANLLKQKDFRNFNFLPFISLFWDNELLAINIGVANHSIQIALIKSLFFMENKSKSQLFWETFFTKLMVLAFGLFWALVLMRVFNIWFMEGLSWLLVFTPIIAFLITSLSYIVLLYAYMYFFKIKDKRKPKNSEKRNGEVRINRSKGIAQIIILIISILIAYLWIIS